MAIQRHPVDSYERKVNFWEEFADYKVHKLFGELWALNKKNGRLEASSKFMWACGRKTQGGLYHIAGR